MTKKERFLKALRNEPVDAMVWAPNFDYWYTVNQAEGTLPEKYKDMSANDIAREIGAYIWRRAGSVKSVIDPSVKQVSSNTGDTRILEFHTPVGSIRQVHNTAEGEHRGKYLVEHFVKDLESLKVLKYVVAATHYEADYTPTIKAIEEVGDDGIVLNMGFSIPFIQFAKVDIGYNDAFYMWTDYKDEVDSLLELYYKNFLQGYNIMAEGGADVVAMSDNMDGSMISPTIFKEYAIPFYQDVKKNIAPKGKLYQSHWDGRIQTLLSLAPGCGLDVIEAVITRPMADISISEVLDLLDGKLVMQGGLPAVLVCEEGGTTEEFIQYMKETILPLKGRKGFVLGMGDNVPPNADFTRVEMVSELIA